MAIDRKRLIFILLGLAVVAVLAAMMRPAPLPVDLVGVAPSPLRVTLSEEGRTRVRDRFVVSAPVPGRVLRIDLEPGDSVVAGETVLATFLGADPNLLDLRVRATLEAQVKAADAALGQARASLAQTRSQRDFARSELERTSSLADQGIESPQRLDSARTELRTREDAVEAAEHGVESVRFELAAARAALLEAADPDTVSGEGILTLRSPIDGVVLQRHRESESVVPAGEPILTLGDPARLEVVVDFLSTDAVQMAPGQAVLFEQWGRDEVLHGRVRRVEPYGFTKISALGVEEQRVYVLIDLTDPREEWESLGDGYRVEARVVIWEAESVLAVPVSSLFRRDGSWEVFVAADGRAHRRAVEIGHRNGVLAEVLEGLEEGERVIAFPSDALEEGVRIEERG